MLPLKLIAAFTVFSAQPVAAPAPAEPSTVTTGATGERAKCVNPRTRYAENGSAAPRRLDELPPGRLELTVQREVDGCVIPVVVRDNIAPQADGPPRR